MNTNGFGWLKENLRTRKDWGVALTAFTPIALIFGRAVADVSVSLVAVLFLFDCIVRRQWNWTKKPWVIAALLIWGYSVLRAAFIQGDGGAGLFAAFVWLRYIVFAASMAEWTLAEERGRLWLLYSITGAALFLSVDGLIQYIFGRDLLGHEPWGSTRLNGVYRRPILGITIANLFAPGAFWLLQRKQLFASVFFANICFAVVFLSGDRMGLVFAAVIMMAWLFFLIRAKPRLWGAFVASLCFLAFLITVTPQMAERQIQSTVATAAERGESAYVSVWRSAWDVGMAHPIFGVGMRQYRVVCLEERFGPAETPVTGYPRCHTHPHNAYMEWFSEGGFVGLLGFAGFALIIAISLRQRLLSRESDLVLWGLAVMLGMRLMPFFITTSFFYNWSAIPFWLAVGWAMSYKPRALL